MVGTVLVAMVAGQVFAIRNGASVLSVVPPLTSAFFTNLMALFVMLFLKPRMLANADSIEHMDERQAELAVRHELREELYDCIAALLESRRAAEYQAAAEDTLRIERELRGE